MREEKKGGGGREASEMRDEGMERKMRDEGEDIEGQKEKRREVK